MGALRDSLLLPQIQNRGPLMISIGLQEEILVPMAFVLSKGIVNITHVELI